MARGARERRTRTLPSQAGKREEQSRGDQKDRRPTELTGQHHQTATGQNQRDAVGRDADSIGDSFFPGGQNPDGPRINRHILRGRSDGE